MCSVEPFPCKVGIPADNVQYVIEVMRYASGQSPPERLALPARRSRSDPAYLRGLTIPLSQA